MGGGFAHHLFEHFGEEELIGITDRAGDIANGQPGIQSQFGSLAHPVVDQIGLNAGAHPVFEQGAQIAALQADMRSNGLHRDRIRIVHLNKVHDLGDICFFGELLLGWKDVFVCMIDQNGEKLV
ncbi:hypothetical protein D3C76_1496680 [compost metagenome]